MTATLDDLYRMVESGEIDIPGVDAVPEKKEASYPDSTYLVVSKVGYLLGVPKSVFETGQLKMEHYQSMEQNKEARIVRNLCMLRNNIEHNYVKINSAFRNDIKNLHTLPELICQDAITALERDGVKVIKANYPLDKYLMDFNGMIANRINNCKPLMPIWLKWDYVRSLFIMPNGTKPEGVKAAGNEYNAHRNDYPYQVYVNWAGSGQGNILYNDKKFVDLLYQEHEDVFQDVSKITDAGMQDKNGIYDFLKRSETTVMVVDCENSDPYKLYATLKNLDEQTLLERIGKIMLYDDVHASSAWECISEFTQIPVEHVMLERLLDHKSLADVSVTTGVCRECYINGIDSFILVSSDSDYWGMIRTLEDARFLVLVEDGKVSHANRTAMDNAGITYCYIDDFSTGNSNEIKEYALLKELNRRLDELVNFNANDLLRECCDVTRAEMEPGESKQFWERYIKPMHLEIDKDGEVYVRPGNK